MNRGGRAGGEHEVPPHAVEEGISRCTGRGGGALVDREEECVQNSDQTKDIRVVQGRPYERLVVVRDLLGRKELARGGCERGGADSSTIAWETMTSCCI